MSKVIIETYKIRTGMGNIYNTEDLTFLNEAQIIDLNNIGYTGKFKGVKTSRFEYLNSLNLGTFIVEQTQRDNGDFSEAFTITRSYVQGSIALNVTNLDYKINIKGCGTSEEIKESLKGIIEAIEDAEQSTDPTSAILDGAEWEDSILTTEISEE